MTFPADLSQYIREAWSKKRESNSFQKLPLALQNFQINQFERWKSLPLPSNKRETYRYFPFHKSKQPNYINIPLPNTSLGTNKKESIILHHGKQQPICSSLPYGWYIEAIEQPKAIWEPLFQAACLSTNDPWILGALLSSQQLICITATHRSAAPLHIGHDLSALSTPIATPLLLQLNPKQQAIIVEDYLTDAPYLHTLYAALEEESRLSWSLLLPHGESRRLNYRKITLAQSAVLTLHNIDMGSTISRLQWEIILAGRAAKAIWRGGYQAHHQEYVATHSSMIHTAEKTESHQLIKGIGESNGQGLFHGSIQIRSTAKESIAHQHHQGWALHQGSILRCRPELEIDTDQVMCSHGATLSPPPHALLHYMLSRSINQREAHQLWRTAFMEEILPPSEFPLYWQQYIAAQLNKAEE